MLLVTRMAALQAEQRCESQKHPLECQNVLKNEHRALANGTEEVVPVAFGT
jgi:hypothetical protein